MAEDNSRLQTAMEKIGRRRGMPIVKTAVGAARALVRGYEGGAVLRNIDTNGEARVLHKLGATLGVVFDVGANVGHWTQTALDAGAKAVHAFEISPATSEGLTKRFAHDGRVTVNPFGLSDAAGSVTIHHYPDHPALTTMTEYPHDAQSVAVEVPVRTGDSYLADNGIDHVDLLKMDVEGAEGLVIEGFSETFARHAVSAVQFEYGRVSILTKYLLRDFYADLTKHGFDVGRITADGVEFMPYDMSMERFDDSNWLAVHESHAELVGLVS
ncbi:MAG: hypothetical protein QOJ00_1202 [Actinomycetota bacterium]|jgi:FkbM family methyltransferase